VAPRLDRDAVPLRLRDLARSRPGGAEWVRALPDTVDRWCDAWQLDLMLAPGEPGWHGVTALVLPVVRADGQPAALKVGWPHVEARPESSALRHWAGRGAARLLEASPADHVLLLERLEPGHDLHAVEVDEAIGAIAALWALLHVPAPPGDGGIPRMATLAREWAGSLPERYGRLGRPFPVALVDAAVGLLPDLAARAQGHDELVHGDLHYANVLAAQRHPWLAIDPKPLIGDPAYDIAPLLWNRWREARATGDPAGEAVRRLRVACDAGRLDLGIAAAWVLVREVANAIDATADGEVADAQVAVRIATAVRPLTP
jgi:streptomycin 6-kinase